MASMLPVAFGSNLASQLYGFHPSGQGSNPTSTLFLKKKKIYVDFMQRHLLDHFTFLFE
jgi:hypothetical protein